MNKLINRFLSLVCVLTILLNIIPVSAFAAEPEITKPQSLSGSYVNPMYEQYANMHTMPVYDDSVATYNSVPFFTSTTKAGAYLRDQMEARNSYITITFQLDGINTSNYVDLYVDALYSIIEEAWKHTGVPTEGDYIHWQILNYGWNADDATGEFLNNYTSVKYDITFIFNYFTTDSMEEVVDMYVDDCIEFLKEEYGPFENNYQAVCAIYDFLRYYVDYDYENLSDSSYYLKHSAYAAIVNGTSVCQGYALLFYRLALELGIDARFIGSVPSEQHCWNIVQLGNRYYNLDATWDDTAPSFDACSWFLLGSDSFVNDNGYIVHTRDSEYTTSTFNKTYPTSTVDFKTSDYEAAPTLSGKVIAASGNPKISWNAVDNTAKYQIYCSKTGKAGSYSLLATTTNTSATHGGASRNQTYYYRIRPVFTNGLKGEISNTVKLTAKYPVPQITATVPAESGYPTLSWNSCKNAVKYEIYRSTTGVSGSYTLMKTTTNTGYANTSAKPGNTYYYRVRAIFNNGVAGGLSSKVKLTAKYPVPQVTGTVNSNSGAPTLTWDACKNAIGYEIYRSTTGVAGSYTLMKTVTGTSYANTSAKPNTTYYYRVRAVFDNGNTGGLSNKIELTAKYPVPSVKVSLTSAGKPKLEWNAVKNGVKYEIYCSTSGKSGSYNLLYTASGTKFTHSSSVKGTKYYYRVRAVFSNGDVGGLCSKITATPTK